MKLGQIFIVLLETAALILGFQYKDSILSIMDIYDLMIILAFIISVLVVLAFGWAKKKDEKLNTLMKIVELHHEYNIQIFSENKKNHRRMAKECSIDINLCDAEC